MSGGRGTRWLGPATVAGYALAAWLVFWPLPILSRTQVVSCACTDPAQQVWFLALGRAQVASGHLSLFTRLSDYPSGANLLANTSMPLLGWISSPVTEWVGPVADYDLLCRLALLLSAAACFFALRRVGIGRAGAGLGGLLYGFSPYMFQQGGLHLFLMFVPLPPLVMMLVYRHLEGGGGRTATLRRGALVALMLVAQLLICSEVLVTTTLMTVLVLAVLLLVAGVRRQWELLQRAARRAAGIGAVVALLAGPVLLLAAAYALDGPEALDGPTKLITVGVHWSNVLLPVDGAELFGHLVTLRSPAIRWYGDDALLGAPIVAVAVVTAVWCRRRVLVQAGAALLVVAWLLSIGPGWGYRDDYTVAVDWAPIRVIWRLPVLQDIMPNRLMLYGYLAAAVLVGVIVDRLVRGLVAGWGSRPARAGGAGPGALVALQWARAGGLAVVVFSLALAAPWPPAAPAYPVNADIAAARILSRAPPGTTVLTYPYAGYVTDQPMLWQAIAGMRVELLGGYLLQPGPEGQTQIASEPLDPDTVPALFEDAERRYRRIRGSFFRRARRQLPRLIRRYDIATVVVDLAPLRYGRIEFPAGRADVVIRLVSDVLGPPQRHGDYDVWDLTPQERRAGSARGGP